MNTFSLPPLMLAVVALYIGLLNLSVFLRRKGEYLFLAVFASSMSIALFEFGCVGSYSATSLEEGVFWQRFQLLAAPLIAASLMWVAVLYLGLTKRTWPKRFTFVLLAIWLLSFFCLEHVVSTSGQNAVRTLSFPVLGQVTYYEATPGWMGGGMLLCVHVVVFWLFYWSAALGFRHRVRRAKLIFLALLISIFCSINDILSQVFVLNLFYLSEYGFFIVFLMITRSEEGRLSDVALLKETHEQLLMDLRQTQKLEALGRFAKGIAHDLNNALTPVMGNAELMLSALEPTDMRREDLVEIIQAVERSRDMSTQLLFDGELAPSQERVATDINRLVKDAARLARCLLRPEVALSLELSPEPCGVLVTAHEINRVLINLTVNALDALPDGGTLSFATTAERGLVVLEVSDDGLGMDEETMSRVFEPFYTTKEKGTGLGLATVKEIVEAHGATVEVRSTHGEGTCFRLVFERVRLRGFSISNSIRAIKLHPKRAGTTLAVVEDDAHVTRFLKKVLQNQGYEVCFFSSAEAAIHGLQDEPEIDLLVTDVMLPGESGWGLFMHLKEKWPGLPVLFISGYAGEQLPSEEEWPEGAALLSKPFSTNELMLQIARLIRGRR